MTQHSMRRWMVVCTMMVVGLFLVVRSGLAQTRPPIQPDAACNPCAPTVDIIANTFAPPSFPVDGGLHTYSYTITVYNYGPHSLGSYTVSCGTSTPQLTCITPSPASFSLAGGTGQDVTVGFNTGATPGLGSFSQTISVGLSSESWPDTTATFVASPITYTGTPIAIHLTPLNGGKRGPTDSLRATLYHPTGVNTASVRVYLDSVDITSTASITTSAYFVPPPAQPLVDGTHTWMTHACATSGRCDDNTTTFVSVGNPPPTTLSRWEQDSTLPPSNTSSYGANLGGLPLPPVNLRGCPQVQGAPEVNLTPGPWITNQVSPAGYVFTTGVVATDTLTINATFSSHLLTDPYTCGTITWAPGFAWSYWTGADSTSILWHQYPYSDVSQLFAAGLNRLAPNGGLPDGGTLLAIITGRAAMGEIRAGVWNRQTLASSRPGPFERRGGLAAPLVPVLFNRAVPMLGGMRQPANHIKPSSFQLSLNGVALVTNGNLVRTGTGIPTPVIDRFGATVKIPLSDALVHRFLISNPSGDQGGWNEMIATISDSNGLTTSVRSRYVHVTPGGGSPGPIPLTALRDFRHLDQADCAAFGAFQCGGVIATIGVPGFVTRDRDRSLHLVYRSGSQTAPTIVPFQFRVDQLSKAPDSLRITPREGTTIVGDSLRYAGLSGTPANSGGTPMQEDANETRVVGAEVKAATAQAAIRNIGVELKHYYGGVTRADTLTQPVVQLYLTDTTSTRFGAGWQLAELGRLITGLSWQGVPAAIWVSGDGSYTIYTKPASTWIAPPGETAQLVQTSDTSAFYILKLDNGAQVAFRQDGWQAWTQDLIGNRTKYSYDGTSANHKTRLLKITDPTGIAFEFGYGSSGGALARVTSIRVRASGAGTTRLVDSLAYDSTGRLLKSFLAVNGTPAGVKDSTLFSYHSITTYGSMLTGITDPRSTAAAPIVMSFTYDTVLFTPETLTLPPGSTGVSDILYFRDAWRRAVPRIGFGRTTGTSTLQPKDRLVMADQLRGTSVNGDGGSTEFKIGKFLGTTWVRRIAPPAVFVAPFQLEDWGGDDIRRIDRDTTGRATKIVQGWRSSDQPDSVMYHFDARNRLDRIIRNTQLYPVTASITRDTFNFTFDSVSVASTGGWCNRMIRSTDAMSGVDTVIFGTGTGPAQCLPTRVIGAAKDTTIFAYGPLTVGNTAGARPTSTTDPAGQVINATYHAGTWNTLTVTRPADAAVTTMYYNPYGWVDSIIDPVGARTAFRRDSLGRVTHHKVGTGSLAPATRTTYLPGGLASQTEVYASTGENLDSPQGTIQLTRNFFNRLGQVDSTLYPGTRPAARRLAYAARDHFGNPMRAYLGNGSMIGKTYDWQGRVSGMSYTPVQPGVSWDGEGYFADTYSQTQWNLAQLNGGQLSQGQNYSYSYDNKGHPDIVTHSDAVFPGGGANVSIRTMDYSTVGQLIWDRLAYTDGVTVTRTYEYNRRGQRTLAVDSVSVAAGKSFSGEPVGKTVFAYDSARGGLLLQIKGFVGNSSAAAVEYGRVDLAYGRGNRLATRTVVLDSSSSTTNKVKTTYTYDAVGQVSSQVTTNVNMSGAVGTGWYSATSTLFNKVGDLLSYSQTSMAPPSASTYTYNYTTDGTRRLIRQSSSASGAQSDWTYDVFGNRLTTITDACGFTENSTYGSDSRLLSSRKLSCPSTTAHWYWTDHTGNRLGATDTVASAIPVNTRMTYTAANQLAWSFQNDQGFSNPATFSVDWHWYGADGLREITEVLSTVPDSYQTRVPGTGYRTYYFYDGPDAGLTVYRAPGSNGFSIRQRYLTGGTDQQLVMRYLSQSLALIADRQGTTVGAVQANGLRSSQINALATTAFGTPEISSATAPVNNSETGFAGASTPSAGAGGLTYMRNRWYDPQTGRFLTQDPIGLAGGVNLYAYAGNNPIAYTDPFGLCPDGLSPGKSLLCNAIEATSTALGTLGGFVTGASAGALEIAGSAGVLAPVAAVGLASTTAAGGVIGLKAGQALTSQLFARDGDLPGKGKPNSSAAKDNGSGKGQIREYGPDGRAKKDFDFGHDHGAGDPHAHDWDWSKNPPRQPGRPIGPDE